MSTVGWVAVGAGGAVAIAAVIGVLTDRGLRRDAALAAMGVLLLPLLVFWPLTKLLRWRRADVAQLGLLTDADMRRTRLLAVGNYVYVRVPRWRKDGTP